MQAVKRFESETDTCEYLENNYANMPGGEMQMSRVKTALKTIFNSIVIAGVIILVVGLYYSVVKAGIPYQDPPLELQIQYAINTGIGETLLKHGFLITVFGAVLRIVIGIVAKRTDTKRA